MESPFCNHVTLEPTGHWTQAMEQLFSLFPSNQILHTGCLSKLTSRKSSLQPTIWGRCLHGHPVVLHLSEESSRYWIVEERASAIFTHPALLKLTISCANLNETSIKSIKNCPRTPLRHLEIIECNIDAEGGLSTDKTRIGIRPQCPACDNLKLFMLRQLHKSFSFAD